MAVNDHYDLIIIGSGAGGGTLAHKLAPTGKKILVGGSGAGAKLLTLSLRLDPAW